MNRTTVMLHVHDMEALQSVLRVHELDLDCGGPRRLADGGVGVVAFVTPEQLRVLRDAEGIDAREIDIPKQRDGVQVGRGDRFNGGRVHPSGAGRLIEASSSATGPQGPQPGTQEDEIES